jgi:hypothetical protein
MHLILDDAKGRCRSRLRGAGWLRTITASVHAGDIITVRVS